MSQYLPNKVLYGLSLKISSICYDRMYFDFFQTNSPSFTYEIIIVDDGSTDKTTQVSQSKNKNTGSIFFFKMAALKLIYCCFISSEQ